MCGITGILVRGRGQVEARDLVRMRDTMEHRGPDGGGLQILAGGKVGLAHRRLTIIDLSADAAQPMRNEDGTVWITFNGEIYNHAGLRRELLAAGHRFATDHSDTEVLVHGYEEWGLDGLASRIAGDFAFAIWDDKQGSLSLVRDRIGVKPLYFSLEPGLALFGSEIKALLAHPETRRELEPAAMFHYLSFMTAPAPLTMFKGIYKLPAGFWLRIERQGGVTARRYWDAVPGHGIAAAEVKGLSPAAEEDFYVSGVQRRFRDAVECRMMSDVPFGVFLSGGVDSSLNVALMSEFSPRPIETFTVAFKDHTHLNELDEARLIAKKFATNHHEVLIDQQDMIGYLDGLVHHQDEPIADWVCIPLYFVSKLAHDHGVKVVQVGEGSDEQFCGYRSYMGYLELYRKYWQPFRAWLPAAAQRGVAQLSLAAARRRPSLSVYADIIGRAAHDREHFWSGAMVYWNTLKDQLLRLDGLELGAAAPELVNAGLLESAYFEADSYQVVRSFLEPFDRAYPGQDVLTRMIYNEFKLRLPELLLMRVDKIGMSVSLEARVPFLDHRLVEFTMDIPMAWKTRGGMAKYILKKAAERYLPPEIIYRKKMGFGAPMGDWLRSGFGDYVQARMASSRLMSYGYFQPDYIETLFAEHRSGKRSNELYIWTLFNLFAWFDYWIDGKKSAAA